MSQECMVARADRIGKCALVPAAVSRFEVVNLSLATAEIIKICLTRKV